jgi:hypothetical protein
VTPRPQAMEVEVTTEREREQEQPEDPRVVILGKAVSDGVPVDWEGVREENPEATALIENLQFVEKVAEAHRRMFRAAEGEGEA